MSLRLPKGFTLVELIAVLIIVGLIATVTGPMFFDAGLFRQRGFFEETLAAVRYAQKHAVASGCPVRVETTAAGFTLFQSANVAACGAGPYDTPIADPSSGAAAFTRVAPDGVSVAAQNFIFAADGSAMIATATLSINVGGREFRVHRDTGFVERQ